MNVSESSFHVRGDNIIDDRYCLCRDLGFLRLAVAPLPQVDFPTLMIQASMSGASPEVMAATVAAPPGASPWFYFRCH